MVQVPPGQPYGDRRMLEDAASQRVSPVAPRPLARPSGAPQEPVTAGLPTGPGPGPEAVSPPVPPEDPDVGYLAEMLPVLEAMAAGRSRVSQASLNILRRIRGSLPADIYDRSS